MPEDNICCFSGPADGVKDVLAAQKAMVQVEVLVQDHKVRGDELTVEKMDITCHKFGLKHILIYLFSVMEGMI